jgi:cell fate regulator YaaT (PSP1 superfamily)
MSEATLTDQTVEVHFKGNRRAYYQWRHDDDPLHLHEPVIVETERGLDFGRVSKVGALAEKGCAPSCGSCTASPAPTGPTVAAPGKVVRRAGQQEIRTANDLRRGEEDVRRKVIERVRFHNLVMRVSDAEWQWDRAKLTIYFTAEKRVDFRALVRDLAGQFRARIELRQIGVRDEAARITGIGRCGREYCCSTWLQELSPVSLALAKDQHLSLNPSQISGGCGRLLCCLKYEHEFYVSARRRFPKEGKVLRTAAGEERVIAVDIFRERVFLRGEETGPRIIPLIQLREEVERLGAQLPTPENRVLMTPAPVADPVASTPPRETEEGAATRLAQSADGSAPRRRRRRHRPRRGGGEAPPSAPPGEA